MKDFFSYIVFIIIFLLKTSSLEGVVEYDVQQKETGKEKIKRVLNLIRGNKNNYNLIPEVVFILKARLFEEEQKYELAKRFWFKALVVAKDPMIETSLQGWIKVSLKLNKIHKYQHLAKALLRELDKTQNKKRFLLRNGLDFYKLKMLVKKYYSMEVAGGRANEQAFKNKKDFYNLLAKDPTFVKVSRKICDKKDFSNNEVNVWKTGLKPLVRRYFQSLILVCDKKNKKALLLLKKVAPELAINNKTLNLAIVAYSNLIKLLRANSGRKEAAEAYLVYIDLWKNAEILPENLGFTQAGFYIEKIDAYLWAARYRALVGDYKNSKLFINNALNIIGRVEKKIYFKKTSSRFKLRERKAEAFFILAHRIDFEEGMLAIAINNLHKGLGIKQISKIWKKRFLWTIGLYHFFQNEHSLSIKFWTRLQIIMARPGVEAKVYFWLARAYHEVGDHRKARIMLYKLQTEHPFDFYSIVALDNVRYIQSSKNRLSKLFRRNNTKINLKKLERELDISLLKKNKVMSFLLNRTIFFINHDLLFFAKLSSKKLLKVMRKKLVLKNNVEAFAYISKLLFSLENYVDSMFISSLLVEHTEGFLHKWPEHSLIYYPRPFLNYFQDAAKKHSVNISLLFSIARQESAFDINARSHADAIGLMQFVASTAEKTARRIGIKYSHVDEILYDPKSSIALAGSLLGSLTKQYPLNEFAIAAYNAGEFAVNAWISRRKTNNKFLWVELIPFGETRNYVQKVWRNLVIYQHLDKTNNLSKKEQSRSGVKNQYGNPF